MAVIPGYRYDETLKRYFKEEHPGGKRLALDRKKDDEEPAQRAVSSMRLLGSAALGANRSKWVLQRASSRVKIGRDSTAPNLPTSSLCISSDAQFLIGSLGDGSLILKDIKGSCDECLRLVPSSGVYDTNQQESVLAYEESSSMLLAWKPGEARFASVTHSNHGHKRYSNLDIWDIGSRDIVKTVAFPTTISGVSWNTDGSKLLVIGSKKSKPAVLDGGDPSHSFSSHRYLRDDALSCTSLDARTFLIGLRSGEGVLLDIRAPDCTYLALGLESGVSWVASLEDAYTTIVHAPRSSRLQSTCLLDLRSTEKARAYFNLNGRQGGCKPSLLAKSSLGSSLMGFDSATCSLRIFDARTTELLGKCNLNKECLSAVLIDDAEFRFALGTVGGLAWGEPGSIKG